MIPNYNELDPGIREIVRFLNEAGWDTIDSGDGVAKGHHGWEGILDFPHVFILVDRDEVSMITHVAHRLLQQVKDQRTLEDWRGDNVYVEATYSTQDGVGTLMLAMRL